MFQFAHLTESSTQKCQELCEAKQANSSLVEFSDEFPGLILSCLESQETEDARSAAGPTMPAPSLSPMPGNTAVPPEGTTFEYKSMRMSTSHITQHDKEECGIHDEPAGAQREAPHPSSWSEFPTVTLRANNCGPSIALSRTPGLRGLTLLALWAFLFQEGCEEIRVKQHRIVGVCFGGVCVAKRSPSQQPFPCCSHCLLDHLH